MMTIHIDMMTNDYHRRVTTVEAGRPSSSGVRWQSFKILFHRFIDLPSEAGQRTLSPEFTCNGHRWCICIYPRGRAEATTGKLSLYLKHCSGAQAKASYQVSVLDKSDEDRHTKMLTDHKFDSENKTFCWKDFCDRSNILDNCLDDDGTLAIVVAIKTESVSPFVPSNPMSSMITGMFLDEETADVCFQVSSGDVHDDAGDEVMSSPVTFHAHSLILKTCAPMLASLFDSHDVKVKITTVSITDVEPAIFRHLLHYVYGGSVPSKEMKAHAKDIINAADKYSIVSLKLEAEVAYAASTEITMENAIEILLYADSMNCALLKEVVMDFLAENSLSASQKLSFNDVPGYLMKDVLVTVGRKTKDAKDGHDDDLSVMRVSELRRKLAEVGLVVDGSREAMIQALQIVYGDSTEDVETD